MAEYWSIRLLFVDAKVSRLTPIAYSEIMLFFRKRRVRFGRIKKGYYFCHRKVGRVVDCGGLENR